MILARLGTWGGVMLHVDEHGAPMTWPPAGAIHVGVEGQTAYALMPGEEALLPASPAAPTPIPSPVVALAEIALTLVGPDAVLALVAGIIEDINSRLVAAGLEPIPAASERGPNMEGTDE